MPNRIPVILAAAALTAGTTPLLAEEPALPPTPYMAGPVELVEAPNGAIANKRILDGIEEVAWLEPTIEQPAKGIWVFGGYGMAPISIIDTGRPRGHRRDPGRRGGGGPGAWSVRPL